MKQIEMKKQIFIGCSVIAISLIYKLVFYKELSSLPIPNVYHLVILSIIGLCNTVTSIIASKHEKKPYVLAVMYILSIVLVLF